MGDPHRGADGDIFGDFCHYNRCEKKVGARPPVTQKVAAMAWTNHKVTTWLPLEAGFFQLFFNVLGCLR